MKTYTLSFADSIKHTPEHPERTASQPGSGFNTRYQVWTNRRAMAMTIRLQEMKARDRFSWTPCIPLEDGEGY